MRIERRLVRGVAALFTILGTLATVGPLLFAGSAKNQSQTSMVATFRDDPTIPDRIQSDGAGSYEDGLQIVKAIIDRQGDFDLDTNAGGGPGARTVFLDFSAAASIGANPPFTSGYVDGYLSTGGGGLPQMAVGSFRRMRLHVSLPGYFLDFNPNAFPDTSNVLVTRTAPDAWSIEATSSDIAKLTRITTVRGKTVLTDEGNFFMPFKLTVKTK